MIELIKSILEKWACKHDWKEIERVNKYDYPDSKMPYAVKIHFLCEKCGEFKKIDL